MSPSAISRSLFLARLRNLNHTAAAATTTKNQLWSVRNHELSSQYLCLGLGVNLDHRCHLLFSLFFIEANIIQQHYNPAYSFYSFKNSYYATSWKLDFTTKVYYPPTMVNSNYTATFIILPAFSKGRERASPLYPGGSNFFYKSAQLEFIGTNKWMLSIDKVKWLVI